MIIVIVVWLMIIVAVMIAALVWHLWFDPDRHNANDDLPDGYVWYEEDGVTGVWER